MRCTGSSKSMLLARSKSSYTRVKFSAVATLLHRYVFLTLREVPCSIDPEQTIDTRLLIIACISTWQVRRKQLIVNKVDLKQGVRCTLCFRLTLLASMQYDSMQ